MNLEQVIASVRNVPDFPKPGIQFKDITTAMKDPEVLRYIADELYYYYKDKFAYEICSSVCITIRTL